MVLGLLAPAADDASQLGRGAQALADAVHVAPMLLVALWSLLQLAADAFSGPGARGFGRRLAFVGLTLALAAAGAQLGDVAYDDGVRVFSGFLVVDPFSVLLDVAVLVITAGTIAYAGAYARAHRFEYGEQEALLFIAAFGVMMLGHAGSLLAVFLGIETMSIAVYVLVGARWNSRRSPEAALKYFVMGAFASGLLLMGIALLYGATGTMSLHTLAERGSQVLSGSKTSWAAVAPEARALGAGTVPPAAFDATRDRVIVAFAPAALLIPGVLLTLCGVLFKISAVPFHMWTPDAYDGAPTPITGFMAAAVKLGGFAALLKLFLSTFPVPRLVHAPYGWATTLGVIALLTMTVGNLAAVRQNNIKRLLAYSSVAHVGYLLIGVIAAAVFYVDRSGGTLTELDQVTWSQGNGDLAVASVLFYLLTYAVATMGTFACVAFQQMRAGSRTREASGLAGWSGLAQRHPGVALAMTVCLLSLMGMPPLAGFFGKVSVFKVAMTSGDPFLRWLVVAGVVNAVIGAAYYLRIIVTMYFKPSTGEAQGQPLTSSLGVRAVLIAAALLSVVSGVGAQALMDRCQVATAGFRYRHGTSLRGRAVASVRASIEARDVAAADEPEADGESPQDAAPEDSDTPVAPAAGAAPLAPPKPGAANAKPEGAPAKPEATPAMPKAAPPKPGPADVKPEGAPAKPEAAPAKPEPAPAKPEAAPAKPEPAAPAAEAAAEAMAPAEPAPADPPQPADAPPKPPTAPV
ncbi:MAG: NADH-quinone oxidoreductase subunit N, partial [Myxococcota bacterium]